MIDLNYIIFFTSEKLRHVVSVWYNISYRWSGNWPDSKQSVKKVKMRKHRHTNIDTPGEIVGNNSFMDYIELI